MTSTQPAVATAEPTRSTGQPLQIRTTSWSAATWGLLVVLCGALFLDGLDISMVGVALPSIGADLGMTPGALQWIVSGYVLGYGGLLLLGGRASDLLGRRTVFLAAVGVFGAASVVSSLLSDPGALIALRFVKGAAAAFTVPAGLSIITTTFAEGPARNRAFSIYTVCGASGFSMGLVFGGVLTELGWRATFLLPGPIALALLLVGLRVVPTAAREAFRLASFDLAGALTSTGALLLLVLAVVQAPTVGWAGVQTIGSLVVSAALAVTFVLVERRHAQPLLRLGILRSASLVHANVAGAVMFGAYVAFQFVVTIYLQDALGWSPLAMALAFLPAGLIVVVSATRMDRVLARVPSPVLILAGLASFLAGYALFLRVEPSMSYWNFLLPTMVLLGLGFALTFPAVNSQATAGVADHEQGLASGLVNTSIQVGGAVVLAVITAILGSGNGHATGTGELLPHMTTAIGVVAGVATAGLLVTLLRVRPRRRTVSVAAEAAAVVDAAGPAVERAELSPPADSARRGAWWVRSRDRTHRDRGDDRPDRGVRRG
ncbi:Major Facilitator Superfamily protein [Jatrophihabitans endophyticus]|uniref:Major Facilitator Superfamily protein n=1 Tax=Jatrophihabitans endophyticus TaxID=1206085 RepID=A0A1M5UES9_9ACTN|nr:MFS transporter [Jatrophihabitans endophyticus]SHH61346.1 Major Facilitator Superfamily protein [Jatrophihabitans endophyticus]